MSGNNKGKFYTSVKKTTQNTQKISLFLCSYVPHYARKLSIQKYNIWCKIFPNSHLLPVPLNGVTNPNAPLKIKVSQTRMTKLTESNSNTFRSENNNRASQGPILLPLPFVPGRHHAPGEQLSRDARSRVRAVQVCPAASELLREENARRGLFPRALKHRHSDTRIRHFDIAMHKENMQF